MSILLELAVVENNSCVVEEALWHMSPTDINQWPLAEGRTLLHVAMRNNNSSIGQMLLEAGADPNATGDDQRTALHLAVENRSDAMVELLLKFGANANPPSIARGNVKTPLYSAVERGYEEIVETLLRRGARVADSGLQQTGQGALQLALALGNDRIAKLLARHATASDFNAKSERDGRPLLQLAVDYGYLDLIKICLTRGASIEELGSHHAINLLKQAVQMNDTELVQMLLVRGVLSLTTYAMKKVEILNLAMNRQHIPITKLLLQYGAPIDYKAPIANIKFALKYLVLSLDKGNSLWEVHDNFIRKKKSFRDFCEVCCHELELAKTKEIVSGVNFFDLLTEDENALASYAERNELVQAFLNSRYRFEIYGDTMALNCEEGRLRNDLLRKATEAYGLSVTIDGKNYVFKLMSNKDLRLFVNW